MNPLLLQMLLSNLPGLIGKLNAPKPGYQTTEFWLTGVVSVWSALSPSVPAPYNVLVPAAAVCVYTLARGLIKLAHSFGKAQGVPELPELPKTSPTTPSPAPGNTGE